MTGPVVVSTRDDRALAAVKAQLSDLLALQRSDATPSELARLYAVCVTAYRAANLRSMVVANVPFRVVDRAGEPVKFHPLVDLVADNPAIPELLRRCELTLCFWGNTLVYKQRQGRQIAGLQWINPRLYRLRFDPTTGQLVQFDISVRWSQVDSDQVRPEGHIVRADGIYMHGVDFDNDFDGVAPAEAAFDMAGIETEAAQTAVWFLRNRAVPAAILQPKDGDPASEPPGESERNAMKRLLNRILQGSRNAGKTIVSTGRWEWVELQRRFDEVGLESLTTTAREGIAMAFDVPLDLLLPTSSTFAQMYQANQSWVEYFAKNQCRWYARQLNMQLAPEFGGDVRLEPDFDSVFTRDERDVVEVTNQKVQGGYLTLYAAQVATGDDKPDDRLKDIYLVGGEPVHVERLVKLAREGQGVASGAEPALLMAGGLAENQIAAHAPIPDKLPPQPESGSLLGTGKMATVATLPERDEDWLPDDVFRELRDCVRVVARRGLDYDFQPDVLPVDSVAYVRLLLAVTPDAADHEDVLAAARHYIVTREQDLSGQRSFAEVERPYRSALYDLIRHAFSRDLARAQFESRGHEVIARTFETAFMQGLRDVGVITGLLEPGEVAFVREQALAEQGYWNSLAEAVYGEVAAMLDRIQAKQAEARAATDPREAERLKLEVVTLKRDLIAARDRVLTRVNLWVQGLKRIYSQGQLSGQRNKMVRWRMNPKKDHCRTCLALDGQIHRASAFQARGLYPGSPQLECVAGAKGVPVCGCGFEVTTDKASGRLDRVPTFGGGRSLGLAARAEYGEPSGTALLHLNAPTQVLAFQNTLIDAHSALDDVRWTPAGHLHITLVHSPLVSDEDFAGVFEDVMASGLPSYELRATRLDAFEVGEDYRAVVLLIEPTAELTDLQRRVCDEFTARGITLAEHSVPADWTPHITLAYERSSVVFEPRDVDIPVTTGALAFTRGDYVMIHTSTPVQVEELSHADH